MQPPLSQVPRSSPEAEAHPSAAGNGVDGPAPGTPADQRLLCEWCGYDVGKSPADSNCPECGYPVAMTRGSRTGTAWQNHPTWTSFLSTGWQVLRHPWRTFGLLRLHPDWEIQSGDQVARNAIAMQILVPMALIGASIAMELFDRRTATTGVVVVAVVLLFFTPISAVLLVGLVRAESVGLRLIAWRRGYSTPRIIIREICAHASYGWLVGAIPLGAGIATAMNDVFPDILLPYLPPIPGELIGPGAGFVLGMLCFETLAYIGLRRCRFTTSLSATREPSA